MTLKIVLRAALWCSALAALNASMFWSAPAQAQAATDVRCKGCVGAAELGNNSVLSTKIRKNAVTGAHILNHSVSGIDILNSSLTGADIRDGSIQSADIANASIAFEDLAPGARSGLAAFSQTVVVKPVGADTDNCTALYAAHNAIVDAEQRNRYLVYIEPGIYDCRGLGPLTMKEYVYLMGAGRDATLIVGDADSSATATIIAANHTSLRNLEVLNQGNGVGTGAAGQGLLVGVVDDFTVSNVRLGAIQGNFCRGVTTSFDTPANKFAMDDVQIRGGNDCTLAVGIYFLSPNSTVTMNDVDAELGGNASAMLVNGTVTAKNSRFKSATNALITSPSSIVRFAASQLDGAVVFNGGSAGSVKCIGSYNGNFDARNAACQ